MHKTILSALALAIGASASAAQGPDGYTEIASDPTGTVWFVRDADFMNIWSDTTAGKVWVYQDHSKDQSTTAIRSVTYYEINCPERSFRTLQTASYDRNGHPTRPLHPKRYMAEYAPPGSLIDATISYVCTPAQYRR